MPSRLLSSFVINDFETGGFTSTKNAITEWAAIAIDGDTLEEICRESMYVKHNYDPNLTYEQKALDITGIKIEDLVELGFPIKEFVDRMIAVFEAANKRCKGSYQKCILVGHNYIFDICFLQAAFIYCKKDLSKYVHGKEDHHGNFQPAYIDTVSISKMKWQFDDTMDNYKLGTCIDKAGLELNDAHRAINDVIGNTELFRSFINDLRAFSDGSISSPGIKGKKERHFQF